ncbi:MAG: flagellar export protein FliJ [Gammaproteobacteria bacterium]|nr:MAG: flagellar export protein FliJ [Gammaproteobacteria bacterium]
MKKKSARLAPVKKLAENKEKSATEEMVVARNSHQGHEHKLGDLVRYRVEYIEQFHSRAKSGMQSSQLQQYKQFISQLDVAIQQQQQIVSDASQVLDKSQNHWREKHSHKKAISRVVNRFKKQENSSEEKKQQADLDEHNTQKHNQKNHSR